MLNHFSPSLHRHPEGPAVLRASLWPKSKGAMHDFFFQEFQPVVEMDWLVFSS